MLVDYHMPEMNGITFIEKIRKIDAYKDVPIVMVTAEQERTVRHKALKAGANDFLTKPVDRTEFITRVKNMLMIRESQKALSNRSIHLEQEIARATHSLARSEERYALAAKACNDGLWDWDLIRNTVYYSERWKEMLGIFPDEEVNQFSDWINRVHVDDVRTLQSSIEVHTEGVQDVLNCEYRMRHRNGSERWMLCRGLAIRNEKGRAVRIVGAQTDITERKEIEKKLSHNAFHDILTGLPNRGLFEERLNQAIRRYKRDPEQQFAILFIDLDRFKQVNDSIGHAGGDRLLQELAPLFKRCTRDADTVARLAGDEFTILLADVQSHEDVIQYLDRIFSELKTPLDILGSEIAVTISAGVVMSTPEYSTVDAMLRDADLALYYAKAHGKAQYAFFDKSMNDQQIKPLQFEPELKHALEKEEILFYFQPIVQMSTKEVRGFEALMRWNHPRYGLVSPVDFIPVAEESDLILKLGDYAVQKAFEQLTIWQNELPDSQDWFMAINIAQKQFFQRNFASSLESLLIKRSISPQNIILEFSENAITDTLEPAEPILRSLKDLGFKLALDDFGNGKSSIHTLTHFPFEIIKVDRSVVSNSELYLHQEYSLSAILLMAEQLGMEVILEGIENEKDYRRMENSNASGQGFYFSKPKPAEEIRSFFRKIA